MVRYDAEVKKEAIDFIEEVFDDVIEAIKDDESYLFKSNDIDDRFFECVTDRSYSLTDAAFVIENSRNVEEDYGLWEGKDPAEALETQAAFTFANDVRCEVEEIYEDLKLEFDNKKSDVYDELWAKYVDNGDDTKDDDGYDPEEDAEEAAKKFLEDYFKHTYNSPVEVVKLTGDRIRMIERYLDLAGRADLWEGYPCGSSYIDSRCGVGFGMPEIHDYVEFDHMISHAIPDISGKSKPEIRAYLEELKKSNH